MLKFTVLVCLLVIALASNHSEFQVVFEWDYIRYEWQTLTDFAVALKNKEYIGANNSIAGIKVWKDKMYLTIPRWRSGVPVTLAVISLENITKPEFNGTYQNLNPYPNWDMQTLNDCTSLQSVSSIEIDPLGRMWVLDTGRTETLNVKPVAKCSPRLVILDIEQEGAVLRSYEFPDDVARNDSAYLNDIVVDHEDGGMAYITDSGDPDPGIIVFSLRDRKSWKLRHDSMKFQTEAISLTFGNTTVALPTHVDGIALSPPGPNRQLYYSPISCFHMYSIDVSVLKNSSLTEIDNYNVTDLGRKHWQTGGMIMTNKGLLYLGFLPENAIGLWDSENPSIDKSLKKIYQNKTILNWPETFAIDEAGWLWIVTNGYPNFFTNHLNATVINYRVIRSSIMAKNYQYFENGTAPELPVIIAASDRITLTLSSCLTIVLVFIAR